MKNADEAKLIEEARNRGSDRYNKTYFRLKIILGLVIPFLVVIGYIVWEFSQHVQ